LDCKERKIISGQFADCNVVAESVHSETKSYSAALTANQESAPPTIKTLTKAIKRVVQEENRSKNILVFGLPEEEGEGAIAVIDKEFECVGEKSKHESVRVGLKTSKK
jgi:20S proteasome alpha/beta subunit